MKAVWHVVPRACFMLLFCMCTRQVVTAQLRADFISSPGSGCAPVFVHFTDISTGTPGSWKWDLGNGTISFLQNPSTTYFSPGKYKIKLVVKNGSLADSAVGYVVINALPKPLFIVSDTTGCYPLKVSFTDQSQAQEGSITKWEWDLGDGTLSNQQNPVHAYTGPGNYNIILRTTNTAGCVSTISKAQYIKIKDGVKADFSYTGSSQCTPPSIVHFNNKSTGTGTLSYQWSFGDGNTSAIQNPANTYMAAGLYTLQLIVKNNAGCIDTLVKKDSIAVGVAKANFTVPDSVCESNPVQLFNTSKPAVGNLYWNFGNGNTSVAINPITQYAVPGTYNISMVADFGSCKDSVSKPVKVIARAKAAFSADKIATCHAPFTVQFANVSKNAVGYKWLFGDSSSSTLPNPAHTYQKNGVYTVTLIVTNSSGCTDTLAQTDYISAVPADVQLTGLPVSGCAPLSFSPVYTVKSAVPVTVYQWNFGAGSSPVTAPNPVHIYSNAGVYTVSLNYTTADGCSGSIQYPDAVRVGQKPGANFSAVPVNTCASVPVMFSDNSTGTVTGWLWYFGDGITDTARNPSHYYNDTGYFNIKLIATNNGCSDTIVKPNFIYIKPPIAKFGVDVQCSDPFHYAFSNYSVGAGSWAWDFGDGTNTAVKNPVHVYSKTGNYAVKLTVTNGTCTHTAVYHANVIKELAGFTASSTSICKGDSILLQTSGFNTDNVASYAWTLDYRTDTARNIKVAYNKSGLHTISLVITNTNGCTDTLIKKDYITVNGPTADFAAVKDAACLNAGGTIQFADAASTDGTHAIKKWYWNFGDGVSQTYPSSPFAHSYNAEGYYSVGLKVIDAQGCTDSISKSNIVYIAAPKAIFSSPDTMSCENKPINFSNQSFGQSLNYTWGFGDATGSAQPEPVHNYAAIGSYSTSLKITDKYGCADSIFKPAYIHIEDPKALFLVSDSASTCPPLVVNFTNQSKYYTDFSWDFGDATGALVKNPVHYYNYPGTYHARLLITSPGGCTDTIFKKIDIKGPTGSFVYDKTVSCNPGTIGFTAQTQNAQSLVWDFNDGATVNTADSTVSHLYNALGVYVPKMILQDAKGCKVPIAGKDTIRIYGVRAMFTSNTSLVCDKGMVQFADSSVSNDLVTEYRWQTGDGGTEQDQNPAHEYSNSGIYPVRLMVTTLNGCTDTSSQLTNIRVVRSPQVSMRGDSAACQPATFSFLGNIDVADTSALTWKWSFSSNGTSSVQNPAPILYQQDGQYTATMQVTNSLGCTATRTKQIVVHPLPAVSAGNSRAICEKKTTILQATGADKYSWSPASALSCTNCSSPMAAPDSNTTYRVDGETVFGCRSSNTVIINVKHPFTMRVGAGDTLCKGESFHLSAGNAELYDWTPSAGLDNSHNKAPLARPQETTGYQVIGRDSIGCFADTGFVKLVVYPFPTVDLGADKTIAVGSSTELKARISADATVLQWQPTAGLSCSNCANPVASPKQTTSYRLTAINEGGCINKDELTVFVICNNGNIFLPNTFSPNGNGTNDVFYPRGTGLYNIRSMRIFNRWGEPVYEATNFKANDASKGWNGMYKNQPAPNDVYVYFVEVICENNSVLTYSGNIALIR